MNPKYLYIKIVFQFILLFTLCIYDHIPSYLTVTNGYEFDVVVNTVYNNYNKGYTIYEKTYKLSPNMAEAVTVRNSSPKERITSIRIETSDNILLVEYTPEYIDSLWKIYKEMKFYTHNWIFTEKGLF